MASKIDPGDWDRLFAPNAPRRGGPLRALGTLLLIGLVLALVSVGATYAINLRERQVAASIATATSFAATNVPAQTAAAIAETATFDARMAARTATAVAKPTPVPILGVGAVNRNGNLRREPRVAPETVIGQIWVGDQIEFLEQRDVGGQPWYRVRITRPAPSRGGEGVAAGTEGWASASLLSPVAQQP